MSTDDSISEDVSSLGALSHCHISADGDGGKESEASLLSSEGTSASDRHTRTTQTKAGAVERRRMNITPACNKIRNLCLSTDEAFQQGKNLPFINPSSLETLRALVQEIQSSGETDPEIWKDCEGRWLHLFQLVEKQYQEQILAQQEQYQCQIQLIQDEIKALVQLQNRQASNQPHTELSPTPVTATTTPSKDYILPLLNSDCTIPKNVPSDSDSLAAPALTPFSSPSPPLHRPEMLHPAEELAATVLSSGYGTLSTWGAGLETGRSPGEEREAGQGKRKHHWSSNLQDDTATTMIQCQQQLSNERISRVEPPHPVLHQQQTSGINQPLTSWAQRQKLRPKKSKAGKASSQISEYQQQPCYPRETATQSPLECTDSLDQHGPAGPASSSFPLRRCDSLMSEASGLTYWRLNENELYHPLPDSFDKGSFLLLQDASMNLSPLQASQLSLREIYQNKQRIEPKCTDWEGSAASSPLSPQVLTLDPAVNARQSDHTSGVTSPSHFSSPSFHTLPHLYPRVGTPLTPDSMVECSRNLGDTDGISDTSSVSTAGHQVQRSWGDASQAVVSTSQIKTQPYYHTISQQHRTSEEESSRTHTSTLKPCSASGASVLPAVSPQRERASSGEDPLVLSLLRQSLREKHSRHLADQKAYYESEIQSLRAKLNLSDLPQELEKSNRALTLRCKDLEKTLSEATSRLQELEAKNNLLEKQLAEWPDRYAVAGATVKSLQQRLEEYKRAGKEKDASATRWKTRVRQLEDAVERSCREAEEKEARRERDYKMLQDLLGEYGSLTKEHNGVKNNLVSTENKLVDANDQISGLKRAISKLESQVKQLEHENQARARQASHSNTQPSGAGLYHHPDLLLSPSQCNTEPDVTRRKSPCPPSDKLNGRRKSPFPQTDQSVVHRKFPGSPLYDHPAGTGCSVDSQSSGGSWRCSSPRELEQPQRLSQPQSQRQLEYAEQYQREQSKRECSLTPMMKALIELDETRATECRAPWVGSTRATVGFVERRHKESIQDRVGPAADWDVVKPTGVSGGPEPGGARRDIGSERARALLRAQRSLSPEGYRSSSLPPSAHQGTPTTTATKRETLLTPVSARSSPKRCPSENYSTAFGQMMPRQEHLAQRFDGREDQRRHSFHSSNPRKRLQFTTTDREDDLHQSEPFDTMNPPEGNSQQGWDGGARVGPEHQDTCEDSGALLVERLHSLADAERLFDELTQEKQQVEAALSRMPGAGGRVSLQTRLDEVALEKRLERLNRELGSIRMTLKRYHVLRSSANI
ncbi:M-phase phosphoprotein 9 [Genypterus blacodes]|uniref:M-phase phosphoprotein 9 n=1 Tax=Genypterus blacodes TaxID=154954 RepID=UPI003F7659B3